MSKKAIVIYQGDKPVLIYEIKEFFDVRDFLEKKKECETNLKEVLARREKKESDLLKRVEDLEKEVKILKGEE